MRNFLVVTNNLIAKFGGPRFRWKKTRNWATTGTSPPPPLPRHQRLYLFDIAPSVRLYIGCSFHGNQLVFQISRNRLIFQFTAKQFIVGTYAFSLTEKQAVLVYRPLNIPETMYKYYEFFFKRGETHVKHYGVQKR